MAERKSSLISPVCTVERGAGSWAQSYPKMDVEKGKGFLHFELPKILLRKSSMSFYVLPKHSHTSLH